jgi:argininosuccinate lyase
MDLDVLAPPLARRGAGRDGADVTLTLVLVESNSTGTGRLFAARARRLGVEPVLYCADPGRYRFAELDGVARVSVDTAARDELLDRIRAARRPPAGITSSSEYYVAIAARIAADLGLPGPNPDAVLNCRDKLRQRTALARHGVAVPRFAAAATPGEAAAAADRIGYPVVVKPVEGTGSVGVRRCADRSEVLAHGHDLLAATRNERGLPVPGEILVEEYADGAEFSVETFGARPVVVVAKHLGAPPHFVETGHDVPAAVTRRDGEALRELAVAALDALRLDFGAAHVEIRMTASGPRVIEVNPRLAGGMIPELVRAATGIDLITAQLRAVLGRDVGDLAPDRHRHACLRFLTTERAGTVVADPAVRRRAAQVPLISNIQLYKDDGERVAPAVDFRDRLGHVLGVSGRAEDSRAATAVALDRLRTLVRPLPERSRS